MTIDTKESNTMKEGMQKLLNNILEVKFEIRSFEGKMQILKVTNKLKDHAKYS